VALRAHAAVGQDLGDGILGGGALLGLVGLAQRTDVIHRVKVADVLQRIGHTIDKIRFPDRHHFRHRNFAPATAFCQCPLRSDGQHARRLAQAAQYSRELTTEWTTGA
jgi:hypothetical protein